MVLLLLTALVVCLVFTSSCTQLPEDILNNS